MGAGSLSCGSRMSPFLALLLALGAADPASLADEGVRAYEDMDLDAAREHLSQAQRAAPSKDRPRIELWLGIVELERGNEAAARRWMRSALQASPALVPPPNVSPKVRALVEELRPAARPTAPARVVRRTRAAVLPPRLASATPASPSSLAVAPHGGLDAGAPGLPGEEQSPATPAAALSAAAAEPAFMPSPLVLAGAGAGAVAVGALGGGVLLGVLAQGAADAAQSEASATDATARFDEANATAWAANGLYAFGAVAAAVGVGCAAMEMAGVVE